MSAGALARRYAKAIFELAEESGQLDQVAKELADLAATWEASEELREAFENPAVAAETRRALLRRLADQMGLSATVKNAALLLSDRRRVRHVPEVAEAFQRLVERKAGRVRAEVTTASELPDTYFQELQKALESVTGKQVTLIKKQDPSLIGGVVTRVGDKVFDGSLRSRLTELKEELLAE